jgi:hypothetical protein
MQNSYVTRFFDEEGPYMRSRWKRDVNESYSADGSDLVEETEAFLAGTYAAHCRRSGLTVPGWAWLNSFAHRDLEELLEIHRCHTDRCRLSGVEWYGEPWLNAQRILGRDILTFVGNDAVLLSLLQRAVLVPLELRFIHSQAVSGLTEYELVESVRAALRRCLP